MTEDVIGAMGYLCLGSRLKRIGERLQGDVQRLFDERGYGIQTAHYPLLTAVERLGPLTVGEMVEAIGVSQPGITRSLAKLADDGLLAIQRDDADQRKKTIHLTAQGSALIERSRSELWAHIGGALRDLCEAQPGGLIDQLATLETGLAERSLDRRVNDRRSEPGP